MSKNRYKIEIVHTFNPHLLWIKVKENKSKESFSLEQIGLYGLLPLEIKINSENNALETSKCSDWVPAATTLIEKITSESTEIWFTPTLIDRRVSIFDDNIQKYGDVEYRSGDKFKSLSEKLIKSSLAYQDVCHFHQKLSQGEIKTKLSNTIIQDVIKHFINYFQSKGIPKNIWDKILKKQMSVFFSSQQVESALTQSNLEKHNNKHIKSILESKMKDLDLCKDIDDESLGRAARKLDESSESQLSSDFLKRKLHYSKKHKEPNSVETYKYMKKFLEKTSIQCNKKTVHDCDMQQNVFYAADQNVKKSQDAPSLTLQKVNNVKQLNNENTLITEEIINNKELKTKKPVIDKKIYGEEVKKHTIYGPPGINPTQLLKSETSQHCDRNQPHETYKDRGDYYNIKVVEDKPEIDGILSNIQDQKIVGKTPQSKNKTQEEGSNGSITPNDTSASSSLLLQKMIRMRKKKVSADKTDNITLESSESSSQNTSTTENISKDDDTVEDEVECVIARINQKYTSSLVNSTKEKADKKILANVKLINHVNPFQNMDPNISVFVDKLVTPILMVHSKFNKRLEPVYEMRDINFNSSIHLALRNMSIKRPMMLQSISWYTILKGYSLFMISPMGSGKTMGYLPAVCRLVTDYGEILVDSVSPIAIIVCATAESVTNVEKAARSIVNNESVVSCYAGVDELDITTRLLNKCDLLICTPPALVRLLKAKELGVELRRLCSFVLDDCERLADVYVDELKFFFIKIGEMMKNRAQKELKVQFIFASRMWCDFMGALAKKTPDTVICIGAFQECVLYSKANTSVSFVKPEDKIDHVFKFLKDTDSSKRTVIVCRADEEVKMLTAAFKSSDKYILSSDTTMTVQDLYNLNISWAEYNDPLIGPILICCDYNLTHMNITNAHNLIHYSLPLLFSMFCKRFSVLIDNYSSIFSNNINNVKIKILLEETNIEQFPKIINFINRCTDSIPDVLTAISEKVLVEKDAHKAQQFVPICSNLLGLGSCPDMYNCQERHTIFKEHDMPLDWLQKKGTVAFKILHYQSAISFSARLLSNTIDGITTKYPQTYNLLSMKMSMYYSNESNRRLLGIPEIGNICAVSIKPNFFVRCQVIKILNRYEKGNPNHVLVNLIDEEKFEISRDIYLYYLPDNLKNVKSGTVRVRLANIQPLDKDITFSELALKHVSKITEREEDLYLKGNICLIIGNTIFIDNLEVCEDLTSLNKTVVKCNIVKELLGKHAQSNIDHIVKLRRLCVDSGIELHQEAKVPPTKYHKKEKSKASWAYLDIDDIACIYFNSAISPDTFFVRLDKFVSCMTDLAKDIQSYVKNNMEPLTEASKGDIVLAKFPDDGTFERARVDDLLYNDKIKCFFVDYGDWREIPLSHIVSIPENFINRLPFQAIECRLIGICPPGEIWSDFSVNWIWDNCLEDVSGNMKRLYVKYFTKGPAKYTGGNKYHVVLVDTNTDEDIIVNKLMIDLNLAREKSEEIHYLKEIDFTTIRDDTGDSVENDDDWEKVSLTNSKSELNTSSYTYNMIKKPIRSVPLVESDAESDDLERWNINMTEEFKEFFRPAFNQMMQQNKSELPAIENEQNIAEDYKADDVDNIVEIQTPPVDKNQSCDLDSDDLTSTLSSKSDGNSEPNLITIVQELRRPKLVWRQNKENISVKIQLIVEDYKLKIEDRNITFKADANNTTYGFDIELYAVIDTHKCFHSNNGQYILIKLCKMLNKTWLSLTKDGTIKHWITYDFDSIDTSSDEEVLDGKPLEYIVKNRHYGTESESDDDEIIDDANFIYKK